MSEWRDIESAPRDGTRVLCYDPHAYSDGGGAVVIAEWADDVTMDDPDRDPDDNGWYDTEDCRWFVPTHWMPLPKPPVFGTDDNASAASD